MESVNYNKPKSSPTLSPEELVKIHSPYFEEDNDKVNHPSHYQSMVKSLNIEAIDCMRAAFGNEAVKGFCICNALKYIYRNFSKNGVEDIKKGIWYLNKYLELNKLEDDE